MRRNQQGLGDQECIDILKSQPRGVMSVMGTEGYPYAFPMNFVYSDGKIYFHCAKEGHKIDAIKADKRVSFCVMDEGFIKEGEWALNISSVIIFGRIEMIDDPKEAAEITRKIASKYYPDVKLIEAGIRKSFGWVQALELTIDQMTGKLVNES